MPNSWRLSCLRYPHATLRSPNLSRRFAPARWGLALASAMTLSYADSSSQSSDGRGELSAKRERRQIQQARGLNGRIHVCEKNVGKEPSDQIRHSVGDAYFKRPHVLSR